MAENENPFWRYSLAVYARPGVAEAALRLQEEAALDVNLLLFCCWAAHCGRRLETAELESLDSLAQPWRRNVVQPLRSVRRWLKGRAGDPAVEALRGEIKRQELEAERLAQDALHAALPLEGEGEEKDFLRTAEANLRIYLAVVGSESADLSQLLSALAGSDAS